MKKTVRICSCLFIMILLLMICCLSVYAEEPSYPISEQSRISLVSVISDYEQVEIDPNAQMPQCRFEILRSSADQIIREDVTDPVLFRALLNGDAELRIIPPEGYYVSSLILENDNEFRASDEDLLLCANAENSGTAISLNLSEIALDNGQAVKAAYVSADYAGNDYKLEVSIDVLPTDTPVLEYRAGAADYYGQLIEGGDAVEGWSFKLQSLLPEVLASARENNLQFIGYRLVYDNGSHIDLQPGASVSLYMDAVLEAQWSKINPTSDPDPDPDPDPDEDEDDWVFPSVIIKASDLEKVYDGSPLVASYEVIGEMNGYSLKNVVAEGSIVKAGAAESTITYYELYDPENNRVSTEDISREGTIQIQNGTLTVKKKPLKVTAISGQITTNGEDIYASQLSYEDGGFYNGYKAEGLLSGHTLSGNFVTGHGTGNFKTDIDTEVLQVLDKSGFDVTANYAITAVPGEITVRKNQLIDIPLTITTKSQKWTYDGTEHKLNEYDVTGLVDGDRIINVKFNPDSVITNVGEQDNDILSIEIVNSVGERVPANKYSAQEIMGKLSVEKRDLTVTAITGSITADGEEKYASRLSSPDGSFINGYSVTGLANGHRLSGDFVTGSGKTTFNTGIDLSRLSVLDSNGNNVTANYKIKTVNGKITINAPVQTNVSLVVTAKSGSWVYDGNEHSLNEYTATGLIDGDQIDKVIFKSTSVITNAGTQPNEIQSVVIKSASGVSVNNGKYNIRYIPGTLTVTKYPLTLTAVSDSKTYDGKALNNKNVKASALANSSHKLSADYELFDSNGNTIKNGPVDIGVYTKQVSNVKITSGNLDVTSNYDIKTVDGTLTITDSSGSTRSVSNSTSDAAYYGSTFTIRSDAPYSEFLYLLIDGQKISSDNYTVKEGSTVITMKASYIKTLKSGKHNYSIVSSSKTVDGSFTVGKAPRTGDNSRAVIWIILLVIAALLAAGAAYYLIRRGKKVPHQKIENEPYPYTEAPDMPVMAKTILDLDPMLDQDEDPTMELMKDFKINLDDFRSDSSERDPHSDPPEPSAPASVEDQKAEGMHTPSADMEQPELPDEDAGQ